MNIDLVRTSHVAMRNLVAFALYDGNKHRAGFTIAPAVDDPTDGEPILASLFERFEDGAALTFLDFKKDLTELANLSWEDPIVLGISVVRQAFSDGKRYAIVTDTGFNDPPTEQGVKYGVETSNRVLVALAL